MSKWISILRTGDEFIVTYALPPYALNRAKLFVIGHAAELYLKAAFVKITGDAQRAAIFGHNMQKLLTACKQEDPSFLPNYELRSSVMAVDMMNASTWDQLSEDDYNHLGRHQPFYLTAQYLIDLKYVGLPRPGKSKPQGPTSFAYVIPDDYWIGFFKEVRSYMQYPSGAHKDGIARFLRDLPPDAVHYLSRLYL